MAHDIQTVEELTKKKTKLKRSLMGWAGSQINSFPCNKFTLKVIKFSSWFLSFFLSIFCFLSCVCVNSILVQFCIENYRHYDYCT